MFASSIFKPILENPESGFAMDVFTLIRDEVAKTKDSEKLTVSVEILCQLLQVKIRKLREKSIYGRILRRRRCWTRRAYEK